MDMNLPKDPVILLSFVNTRLRDHEASLKELAENYSADPEEIEKRLEAIGYHYDPAQNQFK